MDAKSSEKSEKKAKNFSVLASKVGAVAQARDGGLILHRYMTSVFLAKKVRKYMQKRGISELFNGVRYAYMATNAEYGVVHCGTLFARKKHAVDGGCVLFFLG